MSELNEQRIREIARDEIIKHLAENARTILRINALASEWSVIK